MLEQTELLKIQLETIHNIYVDFCFILNTLKKVKSFIIFLLDMPAVLDLYFFG